MKKYGTGLPFQIKVMHNSCLLLGIYDQKPARPTDIFNSSFGLKKLSTAGKKFTHLHHIVFKAQVYDLIVATNVDGASRAFLSNW